MKKEHHQVSKEHPTHLTKEHHGGLHSHKGLSVHTPMKHSLKHVTVGGKGK